MRQFFSRWRLFILLLVAVNLAMIGADVRLGAAPHTLNIVAVLCCLVGMISRRGLF